MSKQLIESIEKRLKQAGSLDEASRCELLELLALLKEDVDELSEDQTENAESIAGFVGAATHEATRTRRNPHLLKLAMDGLSESVKDLEKEHPRLTETVNGISKMLSDIGI